MNDSPGGATADVDVRNEAVDHRKAAATEVLPGRSSPRALVGDDDQDAILSAARIEVDRTRAIAEVGVGVFGRVGERLVGGEDEVVELVGDVDGEPRTRSARGGAGWRPGPSRRRSP
jgi:hypothetical protein